MNRDSLNKINSIKFVFIITGFFFLVLISTQCKPKNLIEGKEDYIFLQDIEKLEYEYSLHEGIKFKLLGDFQRSLYFLERCIKIFPFSDVAYFELSNIHFLTGDIDSAIQYAIRAVEIDQENIYYYYHLAQLYSEKEEYKNTIEVYKQAISTFPDDYELYFALGALYGLTYQYSEALNIFDTLESILGLSERISLPREHIFMETGEYEKAYIEIKNLISHFPEEARYYGILAELYYSMGMLEEAKESYYHILDIEHDNGLAQLSLAEFFIEKNQFMEAFFYLEAAVKNFQLNFKEKVQFLTSIMINRNFVENNYEEVEALLKLFIDEYPDQVLPKAMLSEYYINSASYEKAKDLLKNLFNQYSDNIVFAEQLITVLIYNDNFDEIIEISDEIVNKFPESLIIHYFVGIALHTKGKIEGAIEVFERALLIDEHNDEIIGHIYTYLGDLYFLLDRYDESDSYFLKALDIDDTNLIALNNFAYYLSIREVNLGKAKEYSSKTIESEPDNPSFLDTYAWILYKLTRYDDALIFIELAYNHGGDVSYEIVKHYGQILIKHKRFDEALEKLYEAKLLTEDHDEIDKIISAIEN